MTNFENVQITQQLKPICVVANWTTSARRLNEHYVGFCFAYSFDLHCYGLFVDVRIAIQQNCCWFRPKADTTLCVLHVLLSLAIKPLTSVFGVANFCYSESFLLHLFGLLAKCWTLKTFATSCWPEALPLLPKLLAQTANIQLLMQQAATYCCCIIYSAVWIFTEQKYLLYVWFATIMIFQWLPRTCCLSCCFCCCCCCRWCWWFMQSIVEPHWHLRHAILINCTDFALKCIGMRSLNICLQFCCRFSNSKFV